MKIGILYICTGNYIVFWKDFYKSVEKNFLLDSEKHFFIWSDSSLIQEMEEMDSNIHFFYQKAEEWPYPTLRRFEYFLTQEAKIMEMDYLVFMNGNLLVNKPVLEEDILPIDDEELFVTIHPGFYNKRPWRYAYEHNRKSLAYIKWGKGKNYYAGGFNGGKTENYLKMIRLLSDNINTDLSKGIIARWHDESHLNRYVNDYDENRIRILSPAYLYPEGWDLPFEKKIIVRDKAKLGGHEYLRQINN